jgi:hypothetical protein
MKAMKSMNAMEATNAMKKVQRRAMKGKNKAMKAMKAMKAKKTLKQSCCGLEVLMCAACGWSQPLRFERGSYHFKEEYCLSCSSCCFFIVI